MEEMVHVLVAEVDGTEDAIAVFTGPEAEERAEQVKRLKSMANEGKGGVSDLFYSVRVLAANPTNEQLGLGAPLLEVKTDPFVQAAIADIFALGRAIVPAWLDVDWLRYEVCKATNEEIVADGQILQLFQPPQRYVLGMNEGFVESDN